MKIKSILAVSLMVMLATVYSTAQTRIEKEVPVRILPSADKGIVKILFVHENAQSVQVKFYNNEDLYTSDEINGCSFQNGFLKSYDISNVWSHTFWIEVKSKDVSVIYRMTKSKDQKAYEPHLEASQLSYQLVASKD